MSRTFFAYHLTHVFGPFSLESYHTNSDKPTEGDSVYVLSGDRDPENPGVDYFLEGVFRIKRRHLGPWSLRSRGGETREFRYRLTMEPVRVPDTPISLSLADWYSRRELHRFFSSGQNFNPLPTDPAYKPRLDELLAGYATNDVGQLLEDLAALEQQVPDTTEREVLAMARVGQGRFRADLVASWGRGEVCVLTGLAIPEMLIASHIKPWREATNSERLDPMNGLLLAAHVDKLFDRYLLSFERGRNGLTTVMHPRIRSGVRELGIKTGMPLDTTMLGLEAQRRLESYLEEHLQRHRELVTRDTLSRFPL